MIILLVLVVVVLLLFIAERLFPLRRQTQPKLHRIVVNIVIGLSLFSVAYFAKVLLLNLFEMKELIKFSFLQQLHMPFWLHWAFSIVLLDLTYYYWHRLLHEWPFLWRFHIVHHLDPDMDVTTAVRFHFMEVIFTIALRMLQIVLLGVNFVSYISYEIMFQIATYFHHSNIRLPKSVDHAISFLFITPRLHGIHHSQADKHLQRNYSVIFSLWDRLHRTLISNVPQSSITVGVPGIDTVACNTIKQLLLRPFIKSR